MKFIYSQRNSKKKVNLFNSRGKKNLNASAASFFLHQHKHEKSLPEIAILSKANLIKNHAE